MNKLIIVGNGFDLAHGLPTSYKNFIDNFWGNLINNKDKIITNKILYINNRHLEYFSYSQDDVKNYNDFVKWLKGYYYDTYYLVDSDNLVVNYNNEFEILSFKNHFFRIISQESISNWVDIENKYFEILKELISGNNKYYNKDIYQLNQDFDDIKILLQQYLNKNILEKYNFLEKPNEFIKILELFEIKFRNLSGDRENKIFLEFPPEDHADLIGIDSRLNNGKKISQHSLFLDFNYTPTTDIYANIINSYPNENYGLASIIKIHGELNSMTNPINFGFGDEMDDDYKSIEKIGNNAYFENIKSFKYMLNSNYRNLLNWIEANKFQVYIFGHSCGLSDRILLNTIFENHNCRSIKIFYYKNENKDNYTELTNNISRHFNQKKLMRSKLVDKTNSVELPQSVRFNEK